MKQFKNILCVVMNEEMSGPTLERAVSLAENNQAKLTIIDVVTRARMPISANSKTAMKADYMQSLDAFVVPFRQRLDIQHDVLMGTGFLEIIRSVLRNGHDLVIKAAENPDFMERLFGSGDMHLLRKCPCPVLLTKPGEKPNYDCILAAIDFDMNTANTEEQELNQHILDLSSSLALSKFAALHLVHAWDAVGEITVRAWSDNPNEAALKYINNERSYHQNGLDQLREQLKAQIGTEAYDYLSPRFHLQQGSAIKVIPETAKLLKADLVVMGTVARTGISGLLIGNTAETILEQLRCSVLAIKPLGFVSPVKLTD